jgi:type II secretory pathway pseudopilin PulG
MQSLQRQRRASDCTRARVLTHRRISAFSIFELVIVCLIMSILGAVAAPTFFDSLLFHRVESAARRVKADLELARTQARLTSASQTITFTNATSTYTLANIKSLDKLNTAYTVDLRKEPFSLTSTSANFGGAAVVTFDGYGTPSSGGTVTLNAKSHQCTVTLNGTTGDVTITSNHTGGRTAAAAGSL